MKKPKLAVRPYRHSATHKFILDLRPWGKGRMFFKFRSEADAECTRQKTALERHGREAMALPPHEISDFIKGRKTLAEFGATVNEAIDFYAKHLRQIRRCNVTVAQLAEEVLDAKHADGRSPRYLRDLREKLATFSRDFGNRPVASVTVEEIDSWLRAFPGSPKSRLNLRTNVGVMFSFAERRRMLDHNPVKHTAKPKLVDKPPEIFTPDELRELLHAASTVVPDVVPMLTIGAFAGLRAAEIERLDWKEVDLASGHVEVTAAKAKSARRRLIPIQSNLAAWLWPYTGMTGRVVPKNAQNKLARVRTAAGLPRWPKNGLRHSFASYHLAHFKNAAETALELGHTSPALLFNTYREVVRPEEAEKYWKIAPMAETKNVLAFASV
jgi:integrase